MTYMEPGSYPNGLVAVGSYNLFDFVVIGIEQFGNIMGLHCIREAALAIDQYLVKCVVAWRRVATRRRQRELDLEACRENKETKVL